MNRVIRTILLITAITLFLIAAPLVVFYAIGYRVSSTQATPHVVGVLLVETEPRRADLSVDGKVIGRTPRAVPNLFPGTVDVSIIKEGFRPWAKKILIEATRASDFRHLRLFPISPLKDILTTNVERFVVAPNEQVIAVATQAQEISILDTNGQTIIAPLAVPSQVEDMLWSADSSQVLLKNENRLSLLRLNDGQVVALPRTPSGEVIGWDPRLPDRLLFRSDEGAIVAYSTVSQTNTTVIPQSDAVATTDTNIYILDDQSIVEYSYDGSIRRTFETPITEPVASLQVSSSGEVAVLTKAGEIQIATFDRVIPVPVAAAKNLQFSPDGTLLVIQTGPNEMYIYNYSNDRLPYSRPGEAYLVTRLSRSLEHISWLAGPHYLLYQVDDEIFISETDARDHVVTYSLDSTNTGNAYVKASGNGEFLYYIKKDAKGSHLVKTSLSEPEVVTE